MSYSKLFGSIIHSSIWQEPDHVRLVWITMLAMKDRDGIVEASVPGLARASGKTIPETESALAVLLDPIRTSRTPAHEGRRIEAIDGGWRVLNHDLYRDKLDQDERREKAARRVAKHRDKKKRREENRATADPPALHVTLGNAPKRSVTPGDAPKRHADADADADSGSTHTSGSGSSPPSSQPPDLGGAADLGRPAPPPVVATSWRRLQDAWDYLRAKHAEARRAGIESNAPDLPASFGTGIHERNLRACASEAADLYGEAAVAESMRHVANVAFVGAMKDRSLKWLNPAIVWKPENAVRAMGWSIEQVQKLRDSGQRAEPTSVARRELERLRAEEKTKP